jgi:outer membrane protein assembly factor BamB
VSDGHRGWFRSGIGLAHVLPNGQVDRAWQSNVQGRLEFGTLQRAGERLFVSDSLHVIAVDSKTGARLWTSPAIGGAHILSLAANRSACCRGGRRRSPTPARAAP